MREIKSTYVFYCDYCSLNKESDSPNRPKEWFEVESTNLRNDLHLCKDHGAVLCRILDMLEIKYETTSENKIRILSIF